MIFTLGTVIADDAAVSVVGSREASPAGLAMAADIARALTARKLTVIAGLARGIDTVAHRATLDAGGRTVAARAQARMAVEHGRQVILTDRVVAANEWAQELIGRPGVHVAGNAATVLDVTEQVEAMWDELRRLVTPSPDRSGPAAGRAAGRRRLDPSVRYCPPLTVRRMRSTIRSASSSVIS